MENHGLNLMLADKNRLRKKKDIEKVLRKGKSFKQDFLILKVNRGELKQVRFGFVVSKKVSKKAVIRNKIKRRLREIMKSKIDELKKGLDIILIVLPKTETKDFLEIKEVVEKLLKKSKILNS
ncbi:MAG: ribonuclease P protein component [Patescibacteria group bacterium]|nr:ribonuclease P protein component [Patescibacteria group bacterium]